MFKTCTNPDLPAPVTSTLPARRSAISPGSLSRPIISSLLDNDLYKLTMMRVALQRFPAAHAKYRFVCRTKDVDLRPLLVSLASQIRLMDGMAFAYDELKWLGSISYLGEAFVDSLRTFRLVADDVYVGYTNDGPDGQLAITVEGPWWRTILWEVPLLALVSELYQIGNGDCHPEQPMTTDAQTDGKRRLSEKLAFCEATDSARRAAGKPAMQFIEMGTRRRFSRDWQEYVVCKLAEDAPGFRGTSNMDLARRYMLRPYGTMAHEYISAFQALVHPADSQRAALDTWMDVYRGELGIALTDTINMGAFLRDFDRKLALSFSGARQDSGDPVEWCRRLIEHYRSLGIDPGTKLAVFSDNLTLQKALSLTEAFDREIGVLHGIGTNLSNDLGVPRLSIVMKLVALNGRPVAKISDEPEKAICDDPLHLSYLKRVYDVVDAA